MKIKMKFKLTALALLAASTIAHADSYDPATNRLSIPTITLPGGAIYNNVVVTVGRVLSFNTGVPGAADSFDPSTNILTIPSITVNGTTYTNVKTTIGTVVAATAGNPSTPAAFPAFTSSTVKNALRAPSGGTVTYNNNGTIDGIYSCAMANTGMTDASGAPWAPTFFLSVNGGSNGKAKVMIASNSSTARTSLAGVMGDLALKGNTLSGSVAGNTSLNVTFSFGTDTFGYATVNATGSIVVPTLINGATVQQSNSIACASSWGI